MYLHGTVRDCLHLCARLMTMTVKLLTVTASATQHSLQFSPDRARRGLAFYVSHQDFRMEKQVGYIDDQHHVDVAVRLTIPVAYHTCAAVPVAAA